MRTNTQKHHLRCRYWHTALPVWALYMQKVFKDKTLGYSEEEKFDIPSTWTPCGGLATEHKDPLEEGGVDSIFQ